MQEICLASWFWHQTLSDFGRCEGIRNLSSCTFSHIWLSVMSPAWPLHGLSLWMSGAAHIVVWLPDVLYFFVAPERVGTVILSLWEENHRGTEREREEKRLAKLRWWLELKQKAFYVKIQLAQETEFVLTEFALKERPEPLLKLRCKNQRMWTHAAQLWDRKPLI